ncbi:MAG TPA: hypothetical protein VHT21_21555 [Stellaceae bacterium]|nr:hypothetical protein [Stellaceae bacterium]HEX4184266.1 hypothetical protein [Stellaceae bacterium]
MLAFGALAFVVPAANAVVLDSTDIAIGVPNAALSAFIGPYANLHIDLTSTTTANDTYDGEKLVTRVDAASDPSRIGSDQVRGVRFEGERMVLIPPPRRTGETEEHREITWEPLMPCCRKWPPRS